MWTKLQIFCHENLKLKLKYFIGSVGTGFTNIKTRSHTKDVRRNVKHIYIHNMISTIWELHLCNSCMALLLLLLFLSLSLSLSVSLSSSLLSILWFFHYIYHYQYYCYYYYHYHYYYYYHYIIIIISSSLLSLLLSSLLSLSLLLSLSSLLLLLSLSLLLSSYRSIKLSPYNDDCNDTGSNGNICDGDKWCFMEIRRIYITPDRISNQNGLLGKDRRGDCIVHERRSDQRCTNNVPSHVGQKGVHTCTQAQKD